MSNWRAKCICGMDWDDPMHRNIYREACQGSPWRGNPAELRAFDQWFREELPKSRSSGQVLCCDHGEGGVTKSMDDGVVRYYWQHDQRGIIAPMEVKTNGATLDTPTSFCFQCALSERVARPFTVRMIGGNCPAIPKHFPVEHPEVGLPETPVAADEVVFSVLGETPTTVGPHGLREAIIYHLIESAEAMTTTNGTTTQMTLKFNA